MEGEKRKEKDGGIMNPRLKKQQERNRRKKEAVRAYCHARREEKRTRREYRKKCREAWEEKRDSRSRHIFYRSRGYVTADSTENFSQQTDRLDNRMFWG